MKKIIPAILTDDLDDLKNKLNQLRGLTDWVQIDIMDNEFVPNISLPAEDLKVVDTEINLEAHLMIVSPEKSFDACKQAGVKRVIFHLEATDSPEKVVEYARQYGFEVGLAINPETPIGALDPFVDKIDLVLFMSVNPGWQGQGFIPEVLDKVREFKKTNPDMIVEIDGGIGVENIAQVALSGVDYLVSGSAVFENNSIQENLNNLKINISEK